MAYEHEGVGRKKGRNLLNKAGYKVGGHMTAREDRAQDEKMIASAIHKHEKHDHPGEKETKIDGLKSGGRLDKYARGGATKHKGAKTKINIIVGAPKDGDPQAAHMAGMMQGAAMAKNARPPMTGPMPVGAPPMAGPGMPPPPGAAPMPGMKTGGRAIGKMTAGACSGVGREEKADNAEKARKSGKYADGGSVGLKPAKSGDEIYSVAKSTKEKSDDPKGYGTNMKRGGKAKC